MIELTRLNRQKLILNADLIKWLETSPDTVITLINGEKMIVLESAAQVVDLVNAYRRSLLQGLDFAAVSRRGAFPGGAASEPAPRPDEEYDERG